MLQAPNPGLHLLRSAASHRCGCIGKARLARRQATHLERLNLRRYKLLCRLCTSVGALEDRRQQSSQQHRGLRLPAVSLQPAGRVPEMRRCAAQCKSRSLWLKDETTFVKTSASPKAGCISFCQAASPAHSGVVRSCGRLNFEKSIDLSAHGRRCGLCRADSRKSV